jgi:hypothetical protein
MKKKETFPVLPPMQEMGVGTPRLAFLLQCSWIPSKPKDGDQSVWIAMIVWHILEKNM